MIQSKSMARWLAMSVIAGVAALSAAPASAQATLDTVKKRGKILCGVSPVAPGFSYADDKGVRRGFDVDVCRAVSAAIFADPDKVEYVPLNTNVRFQAVAVRRGGHPVPPEHLELLA